MRRLLLLLMLVPIVAMGAADTVKVKGTVRDCKNKPLQGVVVVASRTNALNAVDTASETTPVIIAPVPVKAVVSDSLGYWYMYLLQSLDFTDTQYYNITGMWNGETQFEIREMLITDVDSIDLGDSLAGR